MKIGPYDIVPIETGRFALDGGAMFGIVPWVFWSKTNPPDERQRIDLAARCLLIRGHGRTILVDDGNGTKFTEKLKDIYKLDTSKFSLHDSLARHGVLPEDVTDVLLTHVHFDHAGGSTVRQNGELLPAFPNARYYVQKAHWDLAQRPGEKDRGSFMKDDFVPLAEHRVLEFTDGEGELFPGIRLIVCNGHTTAQQLPLISDGKTSMLFCCDLIPTMSHVPLPYVMAYDVRPLMTIEEKKKILGRASDEGWILFLEHDPNVEAITVKPSEKGFVVEKKGQIEGNGGHVSEVRTDS
ncbi:MAG: MBL fold metallo-hydrolase [Bacteroidia bacterium]|nr:MAG: MBL fold metallo-hydrolase [Bacteroidia bacterium]